ncbi:hypothetical protein IFM89_037414 [Coptis chinensis]|uniref:Uncharacterized protein n=1 Tax=Coptis chinensis TaxID=261450 RepID=A0A835MK46_9MAGN|nr:hypothetical protein IFM89_037414 [Coptis chinensis]
MEDGEIADPPNSRDSPLIVTDLPSHHTDQSLSSPSAGTPSWSSLFSSSKNTKLQPNLHKVFPSFSDGIAIVPQEIIDEGVVIWSDYVVGYFVGKRLSYPFVKESVTK